MPQQTPETERVPLATLADHTATRTRFLTRVAVVEQPQKGPERVAVAAFQSCV